MFTYADGTLSLVCGRNFSLKVNENVAKLPFETVNFLLESFPR